jgi:Zn-dependent protease
MTFISLLFSHPQEYFMWILLVVFSVCLHEYFHALVAFWQGDSTAADRGHLTLNPLVQIGIFPLVLLIFIGITWGATPVNPSRMRHRYSNALVSFAGPFSNILLFFVFCFLIAILSEKKMLSEGMMVLFGTGAILNFVLFSFNMLPVPPLDGFTVLSHFIPSLARNNSELKNAAFFVIFIIAFTSFRKVYDLGAWVSGFIIESIKAVI